MGVTRRTRPDRGQRHKVRQIEGVDEGLPDIRVGVARQGREPGLDRVDVLADRRESTAVDRTLDGALLLGGARAVFMPNRDGDRQMAECHMVGAERLKSVVCVGCLIGGIGIEKRRRFVVENLAQERRDRFALGEPLAANASQCLRCLGLVEGNPAGDPAIFDAEMIEVVEQTGPRRTREAEDAESSKVHRAEPRLETAGQRGVDKHGVEVHGRLGNGDRMALGRDRSVEIGKSFGIIQRADLGHEPLHEIERAIRLGDEGCKLVAPEAAASALVRLLFRQLEEGTLGPTHLVRRREEEKRQMVGALEAFALPAGRDIDFLKRGAPFMVDQPGGRVREL
jgi:hypothetical protein